MKKYSTLLLSSALLLASLANGPQVLAQDVEKSPQTTTTETTTSQATTSQVPIPSSTTNGSSAVIESSTIGQLNQSVTTQQNGNTLSIFYQRSAQQKGLKIDYAIWSYENGQDDLRWVRAQDYQTDIDLQDFKAGQYIIHTYITIDEKPVFLQGLDVNITRPKPSITSSISEQAVLDIAVHNISPDVKEVLLPVWSNVNGQDDLKWYTAQRQANGTYTARIF